MGVAPEVTWMVGVANGRGTRSHVTYGWANARKLCAVVVSHRAPRGFQYRHASRVITHVTSGAMPIHLTRGAVHPSLEMGRHMAWKSLCI